MGRRILFSASSGAPGPLTAFRNHQAVLKPHIQCDIVPLDELIAPINVKKGRRLYYHMCRKLRMISLKKIVPYGENIIFGNFSPIHEVVIAKLNRVGICPSFMWCSTLGQIELTECERRPFVRLVEFLKQGRIKYLFLHHRLYNSIGHFVKEAQFLPYSINLALYKNVRKRDMPGVNLDLFCRLRFGKNVINQILAFQMAETNGMLHINFDIKQFEGIVEMMSSNLVQHKWLRTIDYLSLIAGMDLSLQVTIGESFNYAVCERMCLGVPVLATKDIDLVADDHVLAKHLCVEAPDTPRAIAQSIKKLIGERNLRNEVVERCKQRIAEVARDHNKIVVEQMLKLFN